ncbi:MAG: flotillin-like protein FloA [Opitutales bacterium]|nr:flotillin-like protein FloA [Opitutales bacterium]NRA26822.1 flotillin-like protein FloA [Opitutales bacterium]
MIPSPILANATLIIGVVGVIAVLVLVFILWSFLGTFIKALLAGAPVGLHTLVAMRLRGVPHSLIVDARITAFKAGIELTTDELEAHYLAEGNVIPTVQALIAAEKANINLDFPAACAIDLATRGTDKSVLEAVRTSINPKVIDCPGGMGGRTTIDGVSKDGIQVKVRARVTVRSNLDQYVGSALEETIIARVGEGIVTTIGSAETYKHVLESPDTISRTVLSRGLDVGTAFEILSIDIADVDVGQNVGAQLQESQAVANKNMAQAQAEIRRAAAVALEQEMKAKVEEMRAKLVEAEAQVPQAIAEAFRNGNLGVMDYYRLNNIKADTEMRTSISKDDEDDSTDSITPKA